MENEFDKIEKIVSNNKKIFIFGGIGVVIFIVLVIVVGFLVYWFLLRNTSSNFDVKLSADPIAKRFIVSQATTGTDLINNINSGTNEINSIQSEDGNYLLFISEHSDVKILKKENSKKYTEIKTLYDSSNTNITETDPQPYRLKIAASRDDDPLGARQIIALNLLTNNNSIISSSITLPVDQELGNDTYNMAFYVTKNGQLKAMIYSGDITGTYTNINEYAITGFTK